MSGIGLILNVAKDALLTQQYALDIVSHNIANVNTEGYTRQLPVLVAKDAAPLGGGFMFGRGVEINGILRSTDAFIEDRLQKRESDYEALSEKNIYLNVLEGIFNESSGRSLSSTLSDFWSSWQDLSNNPSGQSERNIIYESGALLAQSFNDINNDLTEMTISLNNSLKAGVSRVNEILTQIADINEQVVSIEVRAPANDLRDERSALVSELSDYIDLSTYEMSDGTLTVTTGRGYILVSAANDYGLVFEDSEVKWESSANNKVIITDTIAGGKLGGWLDIRDEIIPKYSADFNELAEAIVWEMNEIHTQGVGSTGFSSVTGTYAVTDATEELGTIDSGLNFYDKVADGTFEVWLYDAAGALVGGGSTTITIDKDPGGTTLNSLVADITAVHANLTASVNANNQLQITASTGTFAFSADTSNVLAALGVNTFFAGTDADTMAVNSTLSSQKQFIASGKVGAAGEIAAGDNTNALDIIDLQDTGVTIKRWTYQRGSAAASEDVTNITINNYLHSFVGDIGIKSRSIQREKDYNEVVVNQLSQIRDGISAVSLDEEMVELIKYQHAYAAAAKLISVSDEMLNTLLAIK